MLFDHLLLLNSLLVSRQEIIVRLTSVGDVGTNGKQQTTMPSIWETGVILNQSVVPKRCTTSRIHLSQSEMVQTQLTGPSTTMVKYPTFTRPLLTRLRINPDLVPQWIHTCARCKSATPHW